jgi:multiple sugar transport system substrate-binding protein
MLKPGSQAILLVLPTKGGHSTQLRPLEEAQRARTEILKDSPVPVNFVTEQPPQLVIHIQADMKSGSPTVSLIGALHGELAPLVSLNALSSLDSMDALVKQNGIPDGMITLARLGTDHPQYVPWMQATYIMAASKKALQYLPQGAKLDSLTYDQLAQWAANAQKALSQPALGFPAGPTGLMNRFFEGYLYPSHTGGVVTTFASPPAEKIWADFKFLCSTSARTRRIITSCSSRCSRGTCSSPGTMSLACRTRSASTPMIMWPSRRPPVPKAAFTCR